jgi:phosphoglycerate dehydrogenase-like enzyme
MRNHGAWQSTLGTGLFGKQLGLLGLGKIGSLMVPVAKAFGMQVMAWSQHLTQDKTDSLGVTLAPSKEALLESSDFVSIHLVLSERTKHLLQANDLKRMRRTAYLINTSRAAIIELDAMVDALQSQWIAGAGLDVYETEPLPDDDILRCLPNVITTPHLGYVARENYQQFYSQAVEHIEAFLQGSPKRLLS